MSDQNRDLAHRFYEEVFNACDVDRVPELWPTTLWTTRRALPALPTASRA